MHEASAASATTVVENRKPFRITCHGAHAMQLACSSKLRDRGPDCILGIIQVDPEVKALLEAKAQLKDAEQRVSAASGLPKDASGKADYSDDFFGRSAFLAVSGQLNAEAYACALTDVYTFGEPSHNAFQYLKGPRLPQANDSLIVPRRYVPTWWTTHVSRLLTKPYAALANRAPASLALSKRCSRS